MTFCQSDNPSFLLGFDPLLGLMTRFLSVYQKRISIGRRVPSEERAQLSVVTLFVGLQYRRTQP
jgi:hypothetical protein